MNLIYNISIRIMELSLRLASLFDAKAREGVVGRNNWREHLRSEIEKLGHGWHEIVWFHAASLGEFEQGRPLIEELRKQKPHIKILLTFFSPSGYRVQKDYHEAEIVCYLPFDTPDNARDFVEIVKPSMVVFIKYEFWGNFIRQCHKNDIPLYLVSSIFRPSQVFFKSWGAQSRDLLGCFTKIFVQNDQSLRLLDGIGVKNAQRSGDTRFDRVLDILEQDNRLDFVEKFKGNSKLVVAGSTWTYDDHILSGIINSDDSSTKYLIAPHNISKNQINALKLSLNVHYAIYSKMDQAQLSKAKVLILDTVGVLSRVYSYADVSYVGGGFTKSGTHNTLEAAVFSIPIICGPNVEKYDEIMRMRELGSAFVIGDQNNARYIIENLLADDKHRMEVGSKSGEFVKNSGGATKIILKEFMNVLS